MFESFSVIFLSILIEALPFVMLGAIAASLIEIFVTPTWLASHMPKNPFLAYPVAALMGIIFPVCECAIVPIMRKLIKKGTPVGLATTFMLAVPIVNPVVLLSTAYAFPNSPMVWLRGSAGFAGAILVGLTLHRLKPRELLKENDLVTTKLKVSSTLMSPKIISASMVKKEKSAKIGIAQGFNRIVRHTQHELYDVGRFLILGAFVSAAMQVFVPRNLLVSVGNSPVQSILLMMGLGFVLSLCSEADAFVASTFRYQFTTGSLLAFLIYGPMTDIKNTLMLLGAFKAKFVARLIFTISIVCFALAYLVHLLGF